MNILNFLAVLGIGLWTAGAEAKDPWRELNRKVFSPDGRAVALLSPNGVIEVSQPTGERSRRLYHCSPLTAVFSADNSLLCSVGKAADQSASVKLWRIATGEQICTFRTPAEAISPLAFSADNRLIAGVLNQTQLRLWDVETGELRWSLTWRRPVRELSFDHAAGAIIIRDSSGQRERIAVGSGSRVSPDLCP